MLEGYAWFAVTYLFPDGKMYAEPVGIPRYQNLCNHGRFTHPNIRSINACKTKKDAIALAKHWNGSFKLNGINAT